MARDQGETRWQALMNARSMDVALEQLSVPKQRQITQYRPMLAKRHIMREAWAGKRDGHIVGERSQTIDNAVVHVRRTFRIIKKHEFARAIIDFCVRRNAIEWHPRCDAVLLKRLGIKHIGFTALIKGRNGLAIVDDDVSA